MTELTLALRVKVDESGAIQSIARLDDGLDRLAAQAAMAESALAGAAQGAGSLDAASAGSGEKLARINEVIVRGGLSQRSAADSAENFTQALLAEEAAMERLRGELDPVYAATRRYEAIQESMTAALRHGTISAEVHADMLGRLEAQQVKLLRTTGRAARGNASFRLAIQQAGYQVGDFFVQVASGQRAMTAFTQQGSQLLGVLGPWGAVMGAGVSILGALTGGMLAARNAAREQVEGFEDAEEAGETLLQRYDAINRKVLELGGNIEALAALDRAVAVAAANDVAKEAADQWLDAVGRLSDAQSEVQSLQRQLAGLNDPLAGAARGRDVSGTQRQRSRDRLRAELREAQLEQQTAQAALERAEELRQKAEARANELADLPPSTFQPTSRGDRRFDRLLNPIRGGSGIQNDADERFRVARAIQSVTAAHREQYEALQLELSVAGQSDQARERELAKLRLRQRLLRENIDLDSEQAQALFRQIDALSAFEEAVNRQAEIYGTWRDAGESSIRGLVDALGDMELSWEELGDVADSVMDKILAKMMDIYITAPLIKAAFGDGEQGSGFLGSLINGIGSFLGGSLSGGGGTNTLNSGGGAGDDLLRHNGGLVVAHRGQMLGSYQGRPEVMVKAFEGEGVFTPHQMQNADKLFSGMMAAVQSAVAALERNATSGGAGGGGAVSVQFHNYSSAKVTERETRKADGGRLLEFDLEDAVAGTLSKPGSPARSALKSGFGARSNLTQR